MMQDQTEYSAFIFEGSWKAFAPIAFTNLLLTIVTLGIYRFWATTRERRYLWSRTRFIDDQLEWTGTGKELFLGFVMVLIAFGGMSLVLLGGFAYLSHVGHPGLALIPYFLFLGAFFYLAGVARFRMVRYRLGRTYWRGIRGGSEAQGLRYGWSYIWKTLAGYLAMGLLVPWSMVSLWNERWSAMSFGNHRFRSDAEFSSVMWRYALFYLVPIVLIVLMVVVGGVMYAGGAFDADAMAAENGEAPIGFLVAMMLIIASIYVILPLIWLFYYAAYLRLVTGELQLGGLDFGFTARTWDWIKLFLGDVGLVIVTLGVGFIFLGYRHWKFFVSHLEAYGEIDLDGLAQSTTPRARHGEGLFDALDIGAI